MSVLLIAYPSHGKKCCHVVIASIRPVIDRREKGSKLVFRSEIDRVVSVDVCDWTTFSPGRQDIGCSGDDAIRNAYTA